MSAKLQLQPADIPARPEPEAAHPTSGDVQVKCARAQAQGATGWLGAPVRAKPAEAGLRDEQRRSGVSEGTRERHLCPRLRARFVTLSQLSSPRRHWHKLSHASRASSGAPTANKYVGAAQRVPFPRPVGGQRTRNAAGRSAVACARRGTTFSTAAAAACRRRRRQPGRTRRRAVPLPRRCQRHVSARRFSCASRIRGSSHSSSLSCGPNRRRSGCWCRLCPCLCPCWSHLSAGLWLQQATRAGRVPLRSLPVRLSRADAGLCLAVHGRLSRAALRARRARPTPPPPTHMQLALPRLREGCALQPPLLRRLHPRRARLPAMWS